MTPATRPREQLLGGLQHDLVHAPHDAAPALAAEIYRLVSRRPMEAGEADAAPAVGAGETVVVSAQDSANIEKKKSSCSC